MVFGLTACSQEPAMRAVSAPSQQLAWIDRDGRVLQGVPGSDATYSHIWLSPDDRIATAVLAAGAGRGTSGHTLWDIDLSSGQAMRATALESAVSGREVTHAVENAFLHNVRAAATDTDSDIDVVATTDGVSKPVLSGPWRQRDGRWSADRRWLAYVSEESRTSEIYVQTFPDGTRGRWLISLVDGGERPVWRLDSTALFYWAPGGRLMETPMKKGRDLTQPLAPRLLFTVPFGPTAYAASLDGTRFLMAIPIGYQQPSR
jgi:hypothetical protein